MCERILDPSVCLFIRRGNARATYQFMLVYYESLKRELKTKPINECRCDERLKTRVEGSTRLAYTGLRGGLEHIKDRDELIDERCKGSG